MEKNPLDDALIFSGNANRVFAETVCERLKKPLSGAKVKTFSDGEIQIEIDENVRGGDVFVIQPTCEPVNDNLVELLLMIDAFKRASAKRITAVLPYYGYARQDKKVAPRVPISAKLVADLLTVAGAKRIITMDLHADQIQGFFDIPVDHLWAKPYFITDIRERFDTEQIVIVSPDAGGVQTARSYAKSLGCGLVILDKRRPKPNKSEILHVIGEVNGKIAIPIDDMSDTSGTMQGGSKALLENGAKEIHAYVTHGVLSGPAIKRINESPIKTFTVSDSIPLGEKKEQCDKFRIVSVAPLFAEAIKRSVTGDSVTSLFE